MRSKRKKISVHLNCKKIKKINTMKEFVNFMGGRRYSAVSTTDNRDNNSIVQQLNVKPHKSLQSKPSLNRGLSILDSFFHQREQGKRARWPRRKNLFLKEIAKL